MNKFDLLLAVVKLLSLEIENRELVCSIRKKLFYECLSESCDIVEVLRNTLPRYKKNRFGWKSKLEYDREGIIDVITVILKTDENLVTGWELFVLVPRSRGGVYSDTALKELSDSYMNMSEVKQKFYNDVVAAYRNVDSRYVY